MGGSRFHMHDRILGMLFKRAKRDHADRFQQSGKAINDKLRLERLSKNKKASFS
ncbi:hypothetical protein [Brevibacillus brevis]|uniref:Uncharacterized protein n=1 Tax=Brevibacillus brevis TaxID=1393 RepID=A0ABY9SWM1_BREBE|nr:hypothetical protein [Brevibacillus brevis]WNC12131.1 hypothetical protein RGB73_15410 [Brevibacillus brevis]